VSLSTLLLDNAAAALDRAVVLAIQRRSRRVQARAEVLSHDERMVRLAEIREAYGAPALLETPDTYFVRPPQVSPTLRPVRSLSSGGRVLDASWPSTSVPYLEGVRDAYLGYEANRTAHARLYLASEARPAVVLIHGYMAGAWAIEERAWPIEWMHRIGLDVALMVLPFHALRGRAGGGSPPFPGADPRFTNEGFRQAIADLRVLVDVLRERGAPSVGVMGMSLGGYTTSLLATLNEGLSFAVPIIPLASIADFARDQGRLGTGPKAELQHRALEAANEVVSPLARPSQVPAERMLIVGAEADRITPIAHAERLAKHFGAPLLRVTGGHLMQVWRREAFREIRKLWRRLDVV
jgi:pimeloyl-ACP methyl ester carboxylesterase